MTFIKDSTIEWHSRGYLPHIESKLAAQHVIFRLSDSLPQAVLEDIATKTAAAAEQNKIYPAQKQPEMLMDRGLGSCYLHEPEISRLVQNALLWFDGQRYRIHAWVVMPNHVHVLFTPVGDWRVSQIVHSWKSFTATRANQILGRRGHFWQKESFDRLIRNSSHFVDCIRYIEHNPVSAGLCKSPADWEYSSSRLRLSDQPKSVNLNKLPAIYGME